MNTLLLSKSDIKKLISMKEVIDICDKTFQGFGDCTTINPPKVNLNLGDSAPFPPYNASMNAMPAYIGWQDIAGLKWAGGFGGQRLKIGLPFINALILLCDPSMGNFVAAMDGTYITNMRTGGQTAAALKYILKDKKSIKLGLFGAGAQGRTQTMAISEAFDIEELRVYDIVKSSAEKFKSDMESYVKGNIIVCDKAQEAAKGDVVVSVTLAKDGFIKSEWIEKGTVYFPMGSYQECDYETILQADKIIVDHVDQCLHRGALKELADQGKIGRDNIYCTIGDLAVGRNTADNFKNERVLCVPIGTGAMDVAVAATVYKKAVSLSMGDEFAFDI
ncbi:ornithine cyclodeaminase family protein [Lutispora saccharofermentans]|uniref:Ornithine cyclodeaminase family protein n=1 Tax=Lutispora saccharofermentans TaxID=3024236 RepID=A0ABT1ND95_9FIRM|nr:ornithine cyclodeaminase family protein [Lutispora saccharofermentans]MCQ1529205.1 ornithine cyclodeaminase family protein [Lutispora saccharofermentans]